MAKDDYDVIVFKILAYLYAVLKRRQVFDETVFRTAVVGKQVNENYLTDILIYMQGDGFITGISSVKAWGGQSIITGELNELKITSAGIRYLGENSRMKEVKDFLLEKADIIADLIKMVL